MDKIKKILGSQVSDNEEAILRDENEEIKKLTKELISGNIKPITITTKQTTTDEKSEKMMDNIPEKIRTYKHLVISGGSIRAVSQVGALQKLIDEKIIDIKEIKSIAGASAGSLFGSLIVLGFTCEQIWEFLLALDLKKLVKPDLFLFFKKCGVETGQIIYDLIEEIFAKKTGIKNITFKQLYEITQIHFIVVGSCLTTKVSVYYDYKNTPDFKVSLAVRISIGMPGFFVPVIIDGHKYVDGAILNNYPMNIFKDKMDETIGILICNEYNTDYKYPEEYFMAVMNLFMNNYFKETRTKYADNTVYIKKEVSNMNVFNFDLDNATKHKLYQAGITGAEEFIERLHNKKYEFGKNI